LVVYLACFDLAEDNHSQITQITYWLDFLHSFLGSAQSDSKWKVILVGTRADCHNSNQPRLSPELIQKWQKTWPHLPLHNKIFFTSKHDTSSFRQLLAVVKHEAQALMSSMKVPKSFLSILKTLQTLQKVEGHRNSITYINNLPIYYTKEKLMPALQYLHAVGSIVLVGDDLICTDPSAISHMMSNFISPEYVQQTLPHVRHKKVEILSSDQVGKILMMEEDDPKYFNSSFIFHCLIQYHTAPLMT
jgi:hypothetical protein